MVMTRKGGMPRVSPGNSQVPAPIAAALTCSSSLRQWLRENACITYSIARTVLFPVSMTRSLFPSVVMPEGVKNLAVAPLPSAKPEEPAVPANVVVLPKAVTTFPTTLRIVWLSESAT